MHPRSKLRNMYSYKKYPVPNKIKFTMSDSQSKSAQYAKPWNYQKEWGKNELINTNNKLSRG